ncbi:MAG: hypothetical protein IPK64_10990 [bacterium]|nr:hypothetical protein [bacterium]
MSIRNISALVPAPGRSIPRWQRLAVGAIAVVMVAFAATALVIGRQVDEAMARAQLAHPGDGVSALIMVAGSSDTPVAERNRAIWALGQLGADAALPLLRSLAGDAACNHATAVCQHEVGKALALCAGQFNVGALVWRHGELAEAGRGPVPQGI